MLIEVRTSGSRTSRITYPWPSVEPIAVSAARGAIRLFNGESRFSVQLREATSQKLRGSVTLGAEGTFQFDVPDGLYFLLIGAEGFTDENGAFGAIAIEVKETAEFSELVGEARIDNCGLTFEQTGGRAK